MSIDQKKITARAYAIRCIKNGDLEKLRRMAAHNAILRQPGAVRDPIEISAREAWMACLDIRHAEICTAGGGNHRLESAMIMPPAPASTDPVMAAFHEPYRGNGAVPYAPPEEA